MLHELCPLLTEQKEGKAMGGKGFSRLYESPVWDSPECAGIPLKDLIHRILLEFHSSCVFDVVLKAWIISIIPSCIYESPEELLQV